MSVLVHWSSWLNVLLFDATHTFSSLRPKFAFADFSIFIFLLRRRRHSGCYSKVHLKIERINELSATRKYLKMLEEVDVVAGAPLNSGNIKMVARSMA